MENTSMNPNPQASELLEFEIDITIHARSEQELEEKLEAFEKLNEAMIHEDFTAMAHFIQEKPHCINIIKKLVLSSEGNGLLGKVSWLRNPIERMAGVKIE